MAQQSDDHARLTVPTGCSPDETCERLPCAHVAAQLRAQQEALDRANARLRLLGEASLLLGSSLEYETTLASVVQLAVGQLADWCCLYLLDAAGIGRWVASGATTPELDATVKVLNERYPPDRLPTTVISTVLRTGEARLIVDLDDSVLRRSAVDAEHLALYRATATTSYIVVPLVLHGAVCGAISCAATHGSRRYGAEDLALLEELARRAVVAIEHARLFRAEREARQALEEAVQARDMFVSLAAHELRTPLTALYGQLQLMERRAQHAGHLAPRERSALAVCVEQARRFVRLVDKMLDITRIEHGHLLLEPAPLALDALVRQVASELRLTLQRHRLELELPDAPLLVLGDDLRLEQVLQNLLDNAVKYSPAGGCIRLRLVAEGDEAVLSVSDQGVGVSATALPRLFERFYRANMRATPSASGFGIGLYVVREIVTLHGGRIVVASAEGRGSRFTVRLPLLHDPGPIAAQPSG